MKTCSGGIIGMGESDDDVIDLALSLRELGVRSVPVNFLIPIPGTPFESRGALDPRQRTLAKPIVVAVGHEVRAAKLLV